jgi:Zn-dependent protease with chaperone function
MASDWYCQIDGEEHGPLSPDQIRTMAQIGQLTRESLVRKGFSGPWVSAKRVKGVFDDSSIPLAPLADDIPVARLVDTAAPVASHPNRAAALTPAHPARAAASPGRQSSGLMRVRDIARCISHEERKKRTGVIVANVLMWIILALLVVVSFGGLLVALLIGWVINHLMAEYNVRKLQAFGTAASADQFPEISRALAEICQHFGIRALPKVIVLNHPMLNAFAVKFARKRVIVLLSETLEGVMNSPEKLRFVLGHELGHTMLDHGKRGIFEIYKPAAYKAARELTCDNVGTVSAGNAESAKEVLKRLGVGNTLYDRLNEGYLAAEARYIESGITGWLLKNYMTYPPLGKRLRNVDTFAREHA